MTIARIKADPGNCLWFHHDGERYGEIIKQYSENLVTVQDCTGCKCRVKLNRNGKWIAVRNKDFKGENNLRKKDVKENKRKKEKPSKGFAVKNKKRIKIKIRKRKFRKIRKKSKNE